MKTSRKTAGVTLVVTVLIVMLLLAAVVVVTGQLALAARRSSADQDATIRAQYVAESGLARSRAQLRLVSNLLTNANIQVPLKTTTTIMRVNMENLCGPNLASGLPAFGAATLCDAGNSATGLLNAPASSLLTGNRLTLFNYVNPTAFADNGYTLDTASQSPAAAANAYWAQMLGQNGVALSGTVADGSFSSSVGLTVQSVKRTEAGTYVVNLAVPAVNTQGKINGSPATRAIKAQTAQSTYALTFSQGSLARYALLTNHQNIDAAADAACAGTPTTCPRITFTSNTIFSGPVHTNENFRFLGTPYFGGEVTSAGCPSTTDPSGNLSTVDSLGKPVCAGTPNAGAYSASDATFGFTKAGDMANPLAPLLCSSKDSSGVCTNSNPQFLSTDTTKPTVTWNANYVELPKTSTEQVTAAQAGGLYLPGVVSSMNLAVGINVTLSGRAVPEKVQLVSYTQGAVTTNLAMTADKKVFILVGGVWKPAVQVGGVWIDASGAAAVAAISAGTAQSTFNGVIYTEGGITSLKGPARPVSNTATADNTPPALADFSQITVASTNDIHIKSDLKYESSPCSGSNSVDSKGVFKPATCGNKNAANILGIYSVQGDVKIDSPSNYTGTGNSAPPDVKIEAILMAAKGRVTVDGYDKGTPQGQVNLTGGIIENYYGPFGTVNGANQSTGYGRNFVYDERTGAGLAPPSFPTQPNWNGQVVAIDLSGTQFQQKAKVSE
ncbi:DUF4900 domain-containing protein [Deinococcus sp.]|uniref:DUF4900 domain-containing protein n=1 Tax=Deinococcus sp. TaxID=47478 RepID=UPI003C7C1DB2